MLITYTLLSCVNIKVQTSSDLVTSGHINLIYHIYTTLKQSLICKTSTPLTIYINFFHIVCGFA